ncbi:Organic cation transporter protein [Gryllus bimaculatus]|nr:Organic cation transporter protein [Gryllus bimaculatus]
MATRWWRCRELALGARAVPVICDDEAAGRRCSPGDCVEPVAEVHPETITPRRLPPPPRSFACRLASSAGACGRCVGGGAGYHHHHRRQLRQRPLPPPRRAAPLRCKCIPAPAHFPSRCGLFWLVPLRFGFSAIINAIWNITCSNNQWQLSLVGTVHFAGIFLGTILFGFLADRGRAGGAAAARDERHRAQLLLRPGRGGRGAGGVAVPRLGVAAAARLGACRHLRHLLLGEKGGEAAGGPEQVQGLLATVLQVARSRKLLVRALLLFFIWAANAFVYYGLSVNSTSLGGDKYLNFALVCLVEIPGYTVAWLLMNRLGRRMSLGGSLGLCALTCIGAAFVPVGMEWAEIVLFLVGKLGITSSFGVVFVYTAELYPTPMRSAGVGMSSTVARVGAMVAPFAPLLGQVYAPLPLLLFGGVSLIASLFTLALPETLGTRLPDTVDEVEKL